jgi:hypothetical protein
MQPNRLGRVLGVSTRLAAEKLRQKTEAAAAASSAPRAATIPPAQTIRPAAAGQTAAAAVAGSLQSGRRLARGAGRFGAAFWRPFAHATSVLWLQISGVFFALFTLFFIVHATQLYKVSGWQDRHVLAYGFFALLFGWFALTSFWRAHARQKKG